MTDAPVDAVPESPPIDGPIIARPDFAHRLKRCYIMPVLIIGLGAFFLFDGYIRYPKQNERFDELAAVEAAAKARGDVAAENTAFQERKELTKHSETDLLTQKFLGYALPPLGVFTFWFFHQKSRGLYRLEGEILHAPGHPPVPLDAIRQIDKSKWERKGIAKLGYELDDPAGGPAITGTITLDDALYDRDPTDAILEAIEKKVLPPPEVPAE